MRTLAMLLLLPGFAAAEECLPLITEQSEIRFEILQDGMPFSGNFSQFGGEVCFDRGSVSRIDAWMEPGSIDTGLPELDAALADEAFFHASRFPRAQFTSDSIEGTTGEYVAKGTLTLKGTSRRQEIAFRLSKENNGHRANGSLQIERLGFNVGTGEWTDTDLLGNEVTVHFDVRTPWRGSLAIKRVLPGLAAIDDLRATGNEVAYRTSRSETAPTCFGKHERSTAGAVSPMGGDLVRPRNFGFFLKTDARFPANP